ncbi:serine hydrolase [Arthrobacter psychrolactophilus]|uniref:Serine hydrolase n=1 Tax=Arthrobacter psychrolactophilus TaxID=92442 RepID=A0A2V5INH5_9MICC|nr:serine hydrolase domain-containing protein [Arthrobacter psychrolactophilus]PYI38115.1 serine hydrolase [Arthrobacter psychrolactophilus]
MRIQTRLATALATAGLLSLLTACVGAPSKAPGPTISPSAAPASSGTAACVADPGAVVARQFSQAAKEVLPSAESDKLEAAAAQGFVDAASEGAVVAVRSPGGTWQKSYGLADPATKTPMTTGVYQRVGSVTKTFTGTVVQQLVQDGQLELDDPIANYVPEVPNGAAITVRMLLNMTSGIASYTLDEKFMDELFSDPTKTWTPDQLLATGLALPPLFAPGEQFNYSNTNFILLGRVVEKVTSKPFEQVLDELILAPLGLDATSMPGGSDPYPVPHAQGFTLQGTAEGDATPVNTSGWNPTWAWTAGQMVSTVDDLLVYGRALGTGQGLLNSEAQIDRLSSFPDGGGYGLAVGCIAGWVGHTGELPGYNTSVFYDTDTDITVVVLANSDIPSGACDESKTLPDTVQTLPCMDPATRIFTAVSVALDHEFTPAPKQ